MTAYDYDRYDDHPRLKTYTDPDCVQFVEDMENAGLEPYHYQGRFYWEGPAVNVDDYSEAMAATSVQCQMDSMGLGAVVYPKSSDRGS